MNFIGCLSNGLWHHQAMMYWSSTHFTGKQTGRNQNFFFFRDATLRLQQTKERLTSLLVEVVNYVLHV